MKTILLGLLLTSVTFAQGVDRGNGGRFTAQDIYLTIGEIGQELKDFKEYKSTLDFGISGTDVLNELRAKQFLVIVTDLDVIDRNGKKQDAINFSPNEINDAESARYGIASNQRGKRIMIVKKNSWESELRAGRSIKQLSGHELWGMMGKRDDGYSFTTDYFLLLNSIRDNPTAILCSAACQVEFNYPPIYGYGSILKDAFEDLKRKCDTVVVLYEKNSAGHSNYVPLTDSKKACRYNF